MLRVGVDPVIPRVVVRESNRISVVEEAGFVNSVAR